MANITEAEDFPDDHSGDEEMSNPEEEEEEAEEEEDEASDSVAKLLEVLKQSGAIKKVEKVAAPPVSIPFKSDGGLSIKPFNPVVKKPHCNTCDQDFSDTFDLNTHLIEHVTLPFIVLEKLQSDSEGEDDEENVNDWSDEEIEQETEIPTKSAPSADILKKLGGGISISKPPVKDVSGALKPGILKSIIKTVPLRPLDTTKSPIKDCKDILQSPIDRLSTSGSLKLTIKHSPGPTDNFQIVTSTSNGNVSVKKEPPVAVVINTQPPPLIVMSAPTTNTPVSTPVAQKSWETVDTKDGILDSNYIKKEPAIPEIKSVLHQSLSLPQAKIKDEPGIPVPASQPVAQSIPEPLIPKPIIIPKKEPECSVAIIEINGDDSDNDDIMFVDATPPIDKKPTIGVVPTAQIREIPSSGSNFSSSNMFSTSASGRTPTTPMTLGSTEKQHSFDWNAPTKSLESMLTEKSTDAIFQSLLESHRKDGGSSDLGTSEYISLDTLGPKHTCDVCRTTFTDLRLLENHKRATGHSNQIVSVGAAANNSSAVIPSTFGGNTNLMAMNSLFPVKQLAEVAGKLAGASNSGFSHQQNIMVNIHSFPQNPPMTGYAPQQMPTYQTGYRMPDPNQPYQYPQNSYPQYPQQPGTTPMYPNAQVPGYPSQYPSQQPPYQNQYAPQMPSTNMPNQMMGQMPGHHPPGPPMGLMPGQPGFGQMPGAIPTSLHDTPGQQSPNKHGVVGGIKIQNNSQSPAPGQKLIQAPRMGMGTVRTPIRTPMRGRGGRGGVTNLRPMSIRPNVPGQMVRGGKPVIRTPIKRPGEPIGSPNTTPTKKRMDMLLPDRNDNEDCHVVSMQKNRDGVPFIESIKGRQETQTVKLGSGVTMTKTRVMRPPTPPAQSKDANTVANMLAQRGIKITSKAKSPSPPPVVIPNLGSAIQITKKTVPSTSSSFHIPEEKDNSLTLKCDMCHMSYSSFSQLQEHRRQFHNSKSEMGLPVVDLSNENNLIKLQNLGIMNFIPLANREQSGGCYGVPVVSVHNALNGSLNVSLQSLGAGGILSLGPVKPLPKY